MTRETALDADATTAATMQADVNVAVMLAVVSRVLDSSPRPSAAESMADAERTPARPCRSTTTKARTVATPLQAASAGA